VTADVTRGMAQFDGPAAPPRDNGELVFRAPWEARTFALAFALIGRLGLPWDAFRQRLIEQIQRDPGRAYYENWTLALESLVLGLGISDAADLRAATPAQRASL
jgi:nitrile hydratase accessory protein